MKHLTLKPMLLLAAVVICSIMPAAAFTTFQVDGIYYITTGSNNEVMVNGNSNSYNSYSGDVVIPSTVTYENVTYKVTGIDSEAFYASSGLTSVTIPNSVTKIGTKSFMDCTMLPTITIPSSVTSIGDYAWRGCQSLTEIKVENGNPSYCSSEGVLFDKEKTNLIQYPMGKTATSYTIPDGVTTIVQYAFNNCKLTDIDIPSSVATIGDYAFYRCQSLTSVDIPGSAVTLGNYAFARCQSLTSATLSDGVSAIGEYAFKECTSLTRMDIPSGVSIINKGTFYSCLALTSVTIPNSVTEIIRYAFQYCHALKRVEIPNSMNMINDYVFHGCTSMTSLYLPSTIEIIGSKSFNDCTSLDSVTCEGITPPDYGIENSFSPSTFQDATLYVPASSVDTYRTTKYWSNFYRIVGIGTTIATSLTLDKESISLAEGTTAQLTASISPSDVTSTTLSWTSSNDSIATVDENGKVTAVAVGTATITAATTDGSRLSADCMVTVTTPLAASITLDKSTLTMTRGNNAQLTATVTPSSASNQSLKWTTTNAAVATVDSNGMVTAVGEGSAIIIASTTDGSNLSATCTVNVMKSAESISLDQEHLDMFRNETAQLTATVLPSEASGQELNWTTTNAAVATVSSTGMVTAVKRGTATIIVSTTDGSNLSAVCTVTVTAGHIEGDVNNDDEVTIADVNAIVDLILAGQYEKDADVNNDGEVSIADVNAVVDIILSAS